MLHHKRQHRSERSGHVCSITGGPRNYVKSPAHATKLPGIWIKRLQVMQDVRHQHMENAISKWVAWSGASFCGSHILCYRHPCVSVDILDQLDQESWGPRQGKCRRAHMSAMGRSSWSIAASTSSKSSSTWMPDVHSRTSRWNAVVKSRKRMPVVMFCPSIIRPNTCKDWDPYITCWWANPPSWPGGLWRWSKSMIWVRSNARTRLVKVEAWCLDSSALQMGSLFLWMTASWPPLPAIGSCCQTHSLSMGGRNISANSHGYCRNNNDGRTSYPVALPAGVCLRTSSSCLIDGKSAISKVLCWIAVCDCLEWQSASSLLGVVTFPTSSWQKCGIHWSSRASIFRGAYPTRRCRNLGKLLRSTCQNWRACCGLNHWELSWARDP